MSFTLIAYDELKKSIKECIRDEVKSKNLDAINNLEDSIDKLPDPRRIQVRFLLKTIELLDAKPPTNESQKRNQARILNAAVFDVLDHIDESYENSFPRRSPTNSNLYNLLNIAINADKGNKPSNSDKVEMYSALRKFLCDHTYERSNPIYGYLAKQFFDIRGYNVKEDIKFLTTNIEKWRCEVLDEAEKIHLKEMEAIQPAKNSSDIWSLFASSAPTPARSGEKEDNITPAPLPH